jgi:aminoglycoside/choline kinase family phosphotransferase
MWRVIILPAMTDTDPRLQLLAHWLRDELRWPYVRLESASADASFRRYFRIFRADGATRVVMDAPPDKEDIAPYIKVSHLLAECDVHVPEIEAADTVRGLVLLEDLGATHMLARLRSGVDPQSLYGPALEALLRIQVHGQRGAQQLPPYDRAVLLREMQLLPEWFLMRHLQLAPEDATTLLLADTMEWLAREILQQPVVLVHRDYHSRNLMVTTDRNPGVIDFQDALAGPISYDLVSLLKDCYIGWPRARVERWVEDHRVRLQQQGCDGGADAAEFLRWFDLVGLQRHIKVLGIFARLWYRDGKIGYLADLPLTLDYVRDTAARYRELREFAAWIESQVVPALPLANARAQESAALMPAGIGA